MGHVRRGRPRRQAPVRLQGSQGVRVPARHRPARQRGRLAPHHHDVPHAGDHQADLRRVPGRTNANLAKLGEWGARAAGGARGEACPVSAQIITALRKRADDLQRYAETMLAEGRSSEPDLTLKNGELITGRDIRVLLTLATEFRLLANAAEDKT